MLESSHKELKKAIVISQHTQRNWDLSRQVPEEDLDLFKYAVTQCPSKQNFAFYKAHFITNREIIDQIHDLSMGLGYKDENGVRIECTNPQTLANLVVVFEEKSPSEQYLKKFELRDGAESDIFKRDRDMAIGIAAGYLNVIATMAEYRTGCCACYDKKGIQELLNLEGKPILIMGVGFKDDERARREHHVDNVMIPPRKKEEIETTFHH